MDTDVMTVQEASAAMIRIAGELNAKLAVSAERWSPGGEVGEPCPDEWEPEGHEPPRTSRLADWTREI